MHRHMMKQNLQKHLVWAVILSESTHVFCCVFPTIFSVISLLAGLGMVAAMPAFMVGMHDFLHEWELPMIVVSGLVLAIGWAAVLYSDKISCESECCAQSGCAPKKNKAHLVLKIATVLFIFNVLIYLVFHRSTWVVDHFASGHETHIEGQHEGHDHGHHDGHEGHSH